MNFKAKYGTHLDIDKFNYIVLFWSWETLFKPCEFFQLLIELSNLFYITKK